VNYRKNNQQLGISQVIFAHHRTDFLAASTDSGTLYADILRLIVGINGIQRKISVQFVPAE
jgi:hypothetical protein